MKSTKGLWIFAAAVLVLLTGFYLLLRRFLPRVTQWIVGGK